jgi:surfeit locus 1 family protein
VLRALTSPRMLGLHVLAVIATLATVLLGVWQYDVWHSSRNAEAQDLASAPSRPLSRVMSPDDPYPANAIGRPVSFRGEWLPQDTMFVANQRGGGSTGRAGYWVVTPAAVCAGDCAGRPAMLVVRGWTPSPERAPAPPTGRVEVGGWLQPPDSTDLPDADPTDNVLPALRIADAIQHVRQDIYGAYVISATPGAGLRAVHVPSLPEPDAFTAVRNLFYAFEWWVFAGFAVFLWWRWCSDEVARVTGGTTDPASGPPADDEGESLDAAPSDAEVASNP